MIFGRYNTAPGVFLAADLDYLPELRSTTLKHFLYDYEVEITSTVKSP